MKGWVYLITNESMPGLVKVGFSMHDPERRAKELSTTGIPRPFNVAFAVLLEAPQTIEKSVHDALSGYREGKEWFRCEILTARDEIKRQAKLVGASYHESHPMGQLLPDSSSTADIENDGKRSISIANKNEKKYNDGNATEELPSSVSVDHNCQALSCKTCNPKRGWLVFISHKNISGKIMISSTSSDPKVFVESISKQLEIPYRLEASILTLDHVSAIEQGVSDIDWALEYENWYMGDVDELCAMILDVLERNGDEFVVTDGTFA